MGVDHGRLLQVCHDKLLEEYLFVDRCVGDVTKVVVQAIDGSWSGVACPLVDALAPLKDSLPPQARTWSL